MQTGGRSGNSALSRERPTHGDDQLSECAEVHIGSAFKPRYGRLLDAEVFGDIGLRTGAGLPEFRERQFLGDQLIDSCRNLVSSGFGQLLEAFSRFNSHASTLLSLLRCCQIC